MKNLDSVFAAYLIGWGVFFVYYVSVAKRTSDLRAEIEAALGAHGAVGAVQFHGST